ncbi:MAG: sulfatase/phosphatase domain-containing protein [Bacteriovoracaceae bacterium]
MKRLYLILCTTTVLLAQRKPNIIAIMTDDHAKNAVSIYGSMINSTPNIDLIGKEGATFTNAVVTYSIFGSTKAVHLTGKYSHHYYEYPHGWHKVKRHFGNRSERYKLIRFNRDIDEWE